MDFYLLIAGLVCILSIIGGKFFNRIGVPGLLVFLGLGLLFGSDGLFRIPFENYGIMEKISTIALMFIMFYGGFGTNWKTARPVIFPSTLLATAGVVITALLTGVFAHWVLRCSLLEGLLLGAVVSSTDAASVFAILRQKQLNLSGGLAPILEIESGSNDPFAYLLTVVLLGIMGDSSGTSVPMVLFLQIFLGCLAGGSIGFLASFLMRRVRLSENGMQYLFVAAVVLLSYVLPVLGGGNGFLSVYITGIFMGNQKLPHKGELVHFFDGITGMMQLMLFFLLGLLAEPSRLPGILLAALLIALFLTFVSRPTAVFALTAPFSFSIREKIFLSMAGLRGAASIVFAIYVVIGDVSTKNDIFHIVFCIALLSVGIQGSILPWAARKLKLMDEEQDVNKTFSDYQQETGVTLLEIRVDEKSPWAEKTLKEIIFPPGMLAVMVRRGKTTMIPHGDTILHPDDLLVLSCLSYADTSDVKLQEVEIGEHHKWNGKKLRDLKLPRRQLVVMVERKGEYLIPDGNTEIMKRDVLVLCESRGLEKAEVEGTA